MRERGSMLPTEMEKKDSIPRDSYCAAAEKGEHERTKTTSSVID